MANAFKTEADVRAAKKVSVAPQKMDSARKLELDGLLRRLGSITAVFQMRADAVPVPHFRNIRELMDIYISGGIRAMAEGQDFIDQGIKLSESETSDVQRLVRDIFNVEPAGGAETKTAPK